MSITDLLVEKVWGIAQRGSKKFKNVLVRRMAKEKKNIVLGGITLIFGLGMFFSAFSDVFSNSDFLAKNKTRSNKVVAEVVDPLNKINKGFVGEVCIGECQAEMKKIEYDKEETELNGLVKGHPIAVMTPFIVRRDKEVASFLVAIAKKESNWGKHTPKKNGQECWNFWGYRGKENTTDSGYSCFESPEHAVRIVGNRIERLLNQKINTPAKMVVWKCGRDCEATGGQAAANKWISDVAHVYRKLQS